METMKKMKYIIVKDEFGIKKAVLFPESIPHATFRRTFREIVSAGFVRFLDDGYMPYGESISLNLVSIPEDTEIINNSFPKYWK